MADLYQEWNGMKRATLLKRRPSRLQTPGLELDEQSVQPTEVEISKRNILMLSNFFREAYYLNGNIHLMICGPVINDLGRVKERIAYVRGEGEPSG